MRRARSEATTPYSVRPRSPPPRYLRASPQNQLIRESHLHTGRGVADKRGLVGLALDVFPIDKGKRKQQEAEQEIAGLLAPKDESAKLMSIAEARLILAKRESPNL